MTFQYTTVLGVDSAHLSQLAITWPTWRRHKPSLLQQQMVIFFDKDSISDRQVRWVVDHPDLRVVAWPPDGVEYTGGDDKWTNAQRYKMLAGFVYVPAQHVNTQYWLKLDTDTVANGQDQWVDERWFEDRPAIVAHPWGFTKPADQMVQLDKWASNRLEFIFTDPLNIVPNPGWERVCHKRIISWCGFFSQPMTCVAAGAARSYCGEGMLPVRSQDGYLWYFATRMRWGVKRISMKSLGWEHWSQMKNIREAANRVMGRQVQ